MKQVIYLNDSEVAVFTSNHLGGKVCICDIMFLGKCPRGDEPFPYMGRLDYPLESTVFFSELVEACGLRM